MILVLSGTLVGESIFLIGLMVHLIINLFCCRTKGIVKLGVINSQDRFNEYKVINNTSSTTV